MFGNVKNLLKKMSGKKAVLMTISALLLSLLFLFIYSKDSFIPSYYSSQSTNTRIRAMDEFSKSVPTYIGDALEISTYSALNSLYVQYSKSGYLPSQAEFESSLRQCIYCGYFNCEAAIPVPCPQMNGTDLSSLIINITDLASSDLNIRLSIILEPADIVVIQKYPFDIDVNVFFSYVVEDYYSPTEFSRWDKTSNVSRIVLINGLNDPLVGINDNVPKTIKKTNICEGNESCWNFSMSSKFYEEQSFRYTPNGTSFLSRYWGSTESSSCCGIESFMNVSVANGNFSFLDHYYYSGGHDCDDDVLLEYDSIAPDFVLDSKTAGRYGISDFGIKVCEPP